MVFGADMQFWQVFHEEAPFSPHGQISFDGRFSSLGSQIPGVSGISDLADFFLGYPNNAARTLRFVNTNQTGGGFWSWYGQDDFRISPNLSLNIGLRYEYRRPSVDKRNNFVTLVPLRPKFSGPGNALLVTAADDAENDAFCTDPFYSYLKSESGQCLVATSAQRAQLGFTGRTRRTLIFPDKRDLAPRLGITWRPTSSDKFIIRTGYGIFYDLANFNNQHFVDNNPVFSPSQVYTTAVGSPPPLTNGAPTTTKDIFAGSGGVPPLIEQFVSLYVSPDYKPPYFQQWSFGISSQLSQNWALEVNYIGSAGHKLFNSVNLNRFTGDLLANGVFHGLNPSFSSINMIQSTSNSIYHGMTVSLKHVFQQGFTLQGNYTFGKAIDDTDGETGTTTLTPGMVFTVINNTSANPIVGTFSNLPDGGIVTINGNNFQASYSGGDGNDLTLTVVP